MNDLVDPRRRRRPQGGGILNYGELSLDRVVVTDNLENSAGPASFDLGGGGIYNGDGATLNLTDSTVSDNATRRPAGRRCLRVLQQHDQRHRQHDQRQRRRRRRRRSANPRRRQHQRQHDQRQHVDGVARRGHLRHRRRRDDRELVDRRQLGGPGTAGGLMVATFGAPVLVTLENSVVTGNVELQLPGRGRRRRGAHVARRQHDRRRELRPSALTRIPLPNPDRVILLRTGCATRSRSGLVGFVAGIGFAATPPVCDTRQS